jgi:hypothetical protein
MRKNPRIRFRRFDDDCVRFHYVEFL